jgi:hypothetical protein
MKQKRLERVERRRPLVEFNLMSGGETRLSNRRRRGCLSFLTPGLLALAVLLSRLLGLL